jgi:monofunctional chorismate mutase
MTLDELRNKIDSIDERLITLFKERMNVVSKIAAFKQANNLPTLDRRRETEKLQALSGKIDPQLEPFARTLFETLFELSRSYQEKNKK